MSFDWKNYLNLAEELSKRAEEAYLRTSISRAYYGVFCLARNRKGYKSYRKGDVHQKVINDYKNSDNKNEQAIGLILDKLRKTRNDSDYNEDKTITKELSKRIIISAKQIYGNLQKVK